MVIAMKYIPYAMLILMVTVAAQARNVDLSTVPDRQTVQLTIYNSEDLTLVRETRRISFKRGNNPLQFSWANTLIDPTSVELRFLDHADELVVLDTTFPHDRPQVLYWNVQSEFDGEARVEISYFTSGITWAADYICIADVDEQQMQLEGFVRVFNNSGEDYENAEVRLVVGTINLVEKIAQLARIPMAEVDRLGLGEARELRTRGARQLMDAPAAEMEFAGQRPKEIIKEGLSEYFIYTIDGRETVPHGWSKRLRSFEGTTVPFKVQYRYRQPQYGDQLVRMYLLTNDEASNLGSTPLPDGMVRIFRDNGRGGLSFLTAQNIMYVPVGYKIELNLGPDPQVIFELVKLRVQRDNIWMKLHGAEVFRQIGGGVEIDPRSTVAGWDDRVVFTQRIRNYTDRSIDVEVRRAWSGHMIFRSALNPVLHDFQTVQFEAMIEAGDKRDLLFEIVHKQGRNARQNNVTLEAGEITLE